MSRIIYTSFRQTTAGQKVKIHRLYDLQPIVKNTPECAIADQVATNRTITKSYDPVWLGLMLTIKSSGIANSTADELI